VNEDDQNETIGLTYRQKVPPEKHSSLGKGIGIISSRFGLAQDYFDRLLTISSSLLDQAFRVEHNLKEKQDHQGTHCLLI
jgi:hypothetical protein